MSKLTLTREELRRQPFLVVKDESTGVIKKIIFHHEVQFGIKNQKGEFDTKIKDADEQSIGEVTNAKINGALGFAPARVDLGNVTAGTGRSALGIGNYVTGTIDNLFSQGRVGSAIGADAGARAAALGFGNHITGSVDNLFTTGRVNSAIGYTPIDVSLSNAPSTIVNSNITTTTLNLQNVSNLAPGDMVSNGGGFLSANFNSTFTTRLGAAGSSDFPSAVQNSEVSLPTLVTATKDAGLGAALGHALEHDDVGGFADKNRLLRSKIKAVGGSNIIDETNIVVGSSTMIIPSTLTTGGDLTVVTASITCGGNIQAQANAPNLNLIANSGTPLLNLYGQGGGLDPNASIGEIRWYGTEDDGTGNSAKVCYIKAENTESSWAYNSAAGTELVFGITKDGTTTPVDIVHMTGTSGNGRVGISDSTPSYKLDVDGQINATGNVRSGGSALTSDKRLKENITNMDSMIEKIMMLKPRTFDWKKDARCESMQNDKERLNDFGFIAQEILTILPNMVSEGNDPNKTLGVSYAKLVSVLTKGIQELNLKVINLENELTRLRNAKEG